MRESLRHPITRSILAALCAFGLSACDGGSGAGISPPSAPPPPPPPSTIGPNFSEIQAAVFTPTCATAGCHTGTGAPQGLRLDEANSFANLVDIDSQEVPTLKRVQPGDPDNSYLIQKLEGTAAVGSQMPLMAPPLDTATIMAIRQWITDGAIDDRAPAGDPIRVASVAPVPGDTLDTSPAQIIVEFDRDPDASTVTATTFLLIGSGGDATFDDGNEVPVTAASITVPAANTRSAVFDLGTTTLDDDTYQISLLGSGASVILDLDANALDGEFLGALPSGDGIEGGDFASTFEIATPPPPAVTLDDIQMNVFSVNCSNSGCHSGPAGNTLPTGMDLTSADASFASLVNVTSLQQPPMLRVTPGNADDSYLIRKLEGGPMIIGQQMPVIGGPLPQDTIDRIREWIDNGAQR